MVIVVDSAVHLAIDVACFAPCGVFAYRFVGIVQIDRTMPRNDSKLARNVFSCPEGIFIPSLLVVVVITNDIGKRWLELYALIAEPILSLNLHTIQPI